MTTRFPRDEEYFQLHLEHYQEAIAAALFTGDSFHHDFRVTVEDVTPLAATEIAVNFKVRAPATNAPADIASIPATAALVLAKMTVSDLNPKVIAKGLAEALDVTGAQICMTTPIDFELAQCYDGGFGGGDGSGVPTALLTDSQFTGAWAIALDDVTRCSITPMAWSGRGPSAGMRATPSTPALSWRLMGPKTDRAIAKTLATS